MGGGIGFRNIVGRRSCLAKFSCEAHVQSSAPLNLRAEMKSICTTQTLHPVIDEPSLSDGAA